MLGHMAVCRCFGGNIQTMLEKGSVSMFCYMFLKCIRNKAVCQCCIIKSKKNVKKEGLNKIKVQNYTPARWQEY